MDQLGSGHSPRLMDMHRVYHLSDIGILSLSTMNHTLICSYPDLAIGGSK